MTITGLSDLQNRYKNPYDRPTFFVSINYGGGFGLIFNTGPQGFGAAAVPTRTVANALKQRNGGTGKLIIVGADMRLEHGLWILYDRLSHSGGIAPTVTTPITTNLPTAALTRYTSGVGVMAAWELNTAAAGIGAVNGTLSYTNQAGTAGRTSVPVAMDMRNGTAPQGGWFPLQAGDTGVRSIESITFSSTVANGNFGLFLFKPLLMFMATRTLSADARFGVIEGNMLGGFPEILDDACLGLLFVPGGNVPQNTIIVTYAMGHVFTTEH